VARASDVLVTSGAVAIVALGGGSTLDLAKGAAAAARVGKSLGAHDRRGTAIPSPLAPIVAVPTTAGSGSEVTPFAVLVDRDHGEKVVLSAPGLYPVTALLDPALLRSLPRTPLVAAGLDAITHALESFLGLRASPLVDALALGALDRLWVSLPLAADVTRESRPLATLLCASTMAGMAVANGSAGIVHAISNLLAARYGTSHGLVNAAVLAPTLRFLSAARLEHFRRIAAVIGAPSAADVPHAIEDLVRRLMPGLSLASLGVPRQHAPELAAALASDYQTRFNTPRVPDESALLTILQEAF
jgi:alcohol dehydrogenase